MKHTRRLSRRQVPGPSAHGTSTSRPTSKQSRQPINLTTLHDQYVAYLRDEKGLARNSILVYSFHTRNYLATQSGKRSQVLQSAFDVNTMRAYILDYSKGRSSEYIRLMTVLLRSLCHFFFLHGYTSCDSSEAIPRFRKHRLASVPNYLTPEQVESVLGATDRSTRTGSRDYAILLLLARLGLRASEVVSLTLDDIRWRSSEITIHGKGQVVELVPLLSDIGEAIAAYLRNFRQDVPTRRLFLSGRVAHIGLSGSATIGHIVRRAFARIKFKASSRGASHLFRHGLATNMIRQGASMAQIAQVMRHRSEITTATYAKVAFEDLRAVARPWHIVGGQSWARSVIVSISMWQPVVR